MVEIQFNPEISSWRTPEKGDKKLRLDLKNRGQLENLIFRRLENGKLELIVGSRRYRELQALGVPFEEMDKKILEKVSDIDAALIALSENLFRKDFSPIEEARAFATLRKYKIKVSDIAKKVQKSEAYVRQRIALLDMPQQVLELMEQGKIEFSYAVPLKKLKGMEEAQIEMAKEIAKDNRYGYGITTVQKAEGAVEKVLAEQKRREELVAKYGPCIKCGSKNIEETWEDNKLRCRDCKGEWHKETKDPWEVFELKQKAEKMGLNLELESPQKAKLTPKEVAQIVEERKKVIEEVENPDPSFRSLVSVGQLLAPLIRDDNILKLTVDGDEVQLKLIKETNLHFTALRKIYKTGEKCRITVQSGWRDGEDIAHRLPAVKRFEKSLKDAKP